MKRLLLFFILTGYLFTTSGCSSSSEDKESGTPEAEASAEIGEEADFAEEGGEEGGDEFAEEGGDEFADEGMGGDGMSAEGGDEFAEGDEFADEGMGGEVKDPAMGDASEELALDEGAAEEAPAENMAAGEEVALHPEHRIPPLPRRTEERCAGQRGRALPAPDGRSGRSHGRRAACWVVGGMEPPATQHID